MKRLAEQGAAATVFVEAHSIPEPNSGCWLWLGPYGPHYGVVHRGANLNAGRSVQAHRYSYEAFRGSIPNGLKVLHKCDVRVCVNPDHLFLGTQAENIADMIRKGRDRKVTGEAHPNTILTDAQITAILADPRRRPAIAKDYAVTTTTIMAIKRRLSRKTAPVPDGGIIDKVFLVTAEQVLEIRDRYDAGERKTDLARAYGLSHSGVSMIIDGRSWQHLRMAKTGIAARRIDNLKTALRMAKSGVAAKDVPQ